MLSKINPVKVADSIYGVKTPHTWPGPQLNNIEDYSQTCYGIVSRFANDQTNADEIRYSPAGLACQQGVLKQMKLGGKSTCQDYNYYSPPVTEITRQIFKNAYMKTGNAQQAYDICMSQASNSQERKHCLLDKMAVEDAPLQGTAPLFPKCSGILVEGYEKEEDCECDSAAIILWSVCGVVVLSALIYTFSKKK